MYMKKWSLLIFCIISIMASGGVRAVNLETMKIKVDTELLDYQNLANYVNLDTSDGENTITLLKSDKGWPDLSVLFQNINNNISGGVVLGVYSGNGYKVGAEIYNQSGRFVQTITSSNIYYMKSGAIGTSDSCPDFTSSQSYWSSQRVAGIRKLVPRTTPFAVPEQCGWLFRDADGRCNQAMYKTYSFGSYYDWNGEFVSCDKTDLYLDATVGVDVGPLETLVPTRVNTNYSQDAGALGIEYGKTLPTLEQYITTARNDDMAVFSKHYNFRGAWVGTKSDENNGNYCEITYQNGVGTPNSYCKKKVYDAAGRPIDTLSESDSDTIHMAWDYSHCSKSGETCQCPNLYEPYEKIFNPNYNNWVINLNAEYGEETHFPSENCERAKSVYTTPQNVDLINPAEDCAVVCTLSSGVCTVLTLLDHRNNNWGKRSYGMVPCDITNYVDVNHRVHIRTKSTSDVGNIGYYKNAAPHNGAYTEIMVQKDGVNEYWPDLGSWATNIYNTDDGSKKFCGLFTDANCAGTMAYNKDGAYTDLVKYSDIQEITRNGNKYKYLYVCWKDVCDM